MLGQARRSSARESEALLLVELANVQGNQEMVQMLQLRIGASATCTDGACGQVSRIIVNPFTREVTHLAVDLQHRRGLGRLVPVDLVDATTGQIRLRCSLAEFQTLWPAQKTEGVSDLDPAGHAHPDNAPGVLNWVTTAGGAIIMHPRGRGDQAQPQVTVDSVPSGSVEVHRDLTVCATDDEIGQFQGLIVAPGGHQVTHVLLQTGHLRGRKEVAIPISAVTKIGTLLIHLSLTRQQVKDLPAVDIDHPAR